LTDFEIQEKKRIANQEIAEKLKEAQERMD
jgi:hypothetical protein